jgi:hypothetical protein
MVIEPNGDQQRAFSFQCSAMSLEKQNSALQVELDRLRGIIERLRAEVASLRGAITALLDLDELKYSSHGAVHVATKLIGETQEPAVDYDSIRQAAREVFGDMPIVVYSEDDPEIANCVWVICTVTLPATTKDISGLRRQWYHRTMDFRNRDHLALQLHFFE